MIFGYFKFENNTYIKRIDICDTLTKQIEDQLLLQCHQFFFDGNEELRVEDFYPGATESQEIISKIEFDDPDGLGDAVSAPEGYPVCNPEVELHNLIAIFAEDPKTPGRILIQLIDRRRILLPKSGWLIFKKAIEGDISGSIKTASSSNPFGSFVEMESIGLQLDTKLTAVYDGSFLLFKSYYQANRVFDLGDYLVSATDETVREFLSLDCIYKDDAIDDLVKQLSGYQRRRVAKIMALGFVKRFSASEIVQRANKAKRHLGIEVKEGKIKIPESATERGRLLQFLANGIMASYLDDENDYEVNSMRPLK